MKEGLNRRPDDNNIALHFTDDEYDQIRNYAYNNRVSLQEAARHFLAKKLAEKKESLISLLPPVAN